MKFLSKYKIFLHENKKMHLKMLSVKQQPFCSGGDEWTSILPDENADMIFVAEDGIPDSKVHGANMVGPMLTPWTLLSGIGSMVKLSPRNDNCGKIAWLKNLPNTTVVLQNTTNGILHSRDHFVYVPNQWEMTLYCNIRWCYIVMSSLIGWVHIQNDPCHWPHWLSYSIHVQLPC